MQGAFQQVASDLIQPRWRIARLVGAGASAMTIAVGTGFTVTRVGTGDYKLTFSTTGGAADKPGVFVGAQADFESAIMTDLAGYTVVFKAYDTTNLVVEFTIFNSTFAAADLTSTQVMNLQMMFKQSNL